MSLVHWTYKYEKSSNLEQGDLLEITPYLVKKVLEPFHPYYAKHPDNKLFIILTQSCDLVRRDGKCKSEYLALAPVRPLRTILEREFSEHIRNQGDNSQAYASASTKARYQDFLTKVFNNNYPKYFFLQSQPDHGVAEDMCAVLPLSISIKSEHYQQCMIARKLQLEDSFQAKLGYLIGQQYAKVGTRDWEESAIDNKINTILSSTAVWVADADLKILNRSVDEFKAADQTAQVDCHILRELINKIPPKKDLAVNAVMEFLISQDLVSREPSPERRKIRKALTNDSAFSQFFRES